MYHTVDFLVQGRTSVMLMLSVFVLARADQPRLQVLHAACGSRQQKSTLPQCRIRRGFEGRVHRLHGMALVGKLPLLPSEESVVGHSRHAEPLANKKLLVKKKATSHRHRVHPARRRPTEYYYITSRRREATSCCKRS